MIRSATGGVYACQPSIAFFLAIATRSVLLYDDIVNIIAQDVVVVNIVSNGNIEL